MIYLGNSIDEYEGGTEIPLWLAREIVELANRAGEFQQLEVGCYPAVGLLIYYGSGCIRQAYARRYVRAEFDHGGCDYHFLGQD